MNVTGKKEILEIEGVQPFQLDTGDSKEIIIGCHQNSRDCSNVFKAFIGSAMIGMPFAVSQAGIALSLIGIFVIASATDHCCNLIVKCKQIVIKNKIESTDLLSTQAHEEERILNKTISYGSIAKSCLGMPGVLAVNISVFLTQFCFSIGYFIFLGDTVRSILKRYVSTNDSLNKTLTVPRNTLSTYLLLQNESRNEKFDFVFQSSNFTFYEKKFGLLELTTDSKTSFAIFLVIPVVFLILVSFIRSLRNLGPISLVANLSLVIAFVTTAIFLVASLHRISSAVTYFKFSTFPIFFGQLTGIFEGIGTVIPIEGSMGNNRSRYPLFLHCSLFTVSILLASFGIIGYLSFGEKTCQIVTANLDGSMATILQILLFFGVLLTYPLQIYPCIEIMEALLIKYCKWRQQNLMQNPKAEIEVCLIKKSLSEKEVVAKESVSIWEGNLIRIALVSMTAFLGIIFRKHFAYIAALNGAVGGSLLVYILPPIIHISLKRNEIKKKVFLKNILLILYGVVSGIIGLIIATKEIITSFGNGSPFHC